MRSNDSCGGIFPRALREDGPAWTRVDAPYAVFFRPLTWEKLLARGAQAEEHL